MKTNYIKPIILSLLVICSFAACNKNDSKSVPPTKENIAGSYKMTGLTEQIGAGAEANIYNDNLEDCEKDNIYTFNLDGTAAYSDAGTQCNPASDYTAEWSVSGNTFIFDGEEDLIKSFDGKYLVLTITDNSNGTSVTRTSTFTKQ